MAEALSVVATVVFPFPLATAYELNFCAQCQLPEPNGANCNTTGPGTGFLKTIVGRYDPGDGTSVTVGVPAVPNIPRVMKRIDWKR
jgi:hypothetical protein